MPAVKPQATKKLSSSGASPITGSPSAETGIGPLISVRMPVSFRIGSRSAAPERIGSKRSMFSGNSSRAKENGTPSRQQAGASFLPAADRKGADVGLQVKDAVGVAEGWRVCGRADRLFRDDVLMLDRAGGDRDARHLADALRPDAGGVDDDVAADRAVIGDDGLDAPAVALEAGDQNAFADRHASGARRLRVGHCERIGIDVAVGGNPRSADHAVGRHPGKAPLRLFGADLMRLEAKALRLRQRAADLRQPLRARGDAERAGFPPIDRLSRFRLEPIEHGDGILHEPGEVLL